MSPGISAGLLGIDASNAEKRKTAEPWRSSARRSDDARILGQDLLAREAQKTESADTHQQKAGGFGHGAKRE